MSKFSITDKLVIASLFLSIVTITIVASYSFYNGKNAVLERTFNQLNSVRVIKSNSLEKFFTSCFSEISLVKYSSDIQIIISQINEIENKSGYNNISSKQLGGTSPFFNEISNKHFGNIFIIGSNKLVYYIKKYNNLRLNYDYLWNKTVVEHNIFISDLVKQDSLSQPVITISTKITNSSGEIIGIIVFEILSNSIDKIMLESNSSAGLGTTGESYLIGSDYLMRSSSRFHSNSILNTLVKTQSVDSAINNYTGTNIIYDYRGIRVLSSYSKLNLPYLDWVILAEIDYKEVTIPIYKIRNEIIFISIFIFLIVLVVIMILSRRITIPIQKLNQAALEIGKGNLDIELKTNLNDEIGELTETFNKMTVKLKKQSEELVKEKNKSLSSLFDGQESERQRVSRELHDSLGQLLIGLKLKYESCLNQAQFSTDSKICFVDLSLLFDKTIDETRRISNNLMPAALSEFGLLSAIRNLCNEISDATDLKIQFQTNGSDKTVNLRIKIYIYRIIQEAISNIIKHSQAENAEINIIFDIHQIFIDINDDGIGFDYFNIRKENSNGLNNIKDRTYLLSGNLIVKSKESKGTQISITIPLKD